MARHAKTGRVCRLPALLLVVGIMATVGATASAPSSSAQSPRVKPVIGAPVALPAQPVAGKRFTVRFAVTRSDNGRPLSTAVVGCTTSVGSKVVPHRHTFKAGSLRATLVLPTNAGGRILKVRASARLGTKSATKIAAFVVQAQPLPSLSIGDASVAEGNAGTATLAFPLTLSKVTTQPVVVTLTTADGSATAPSDYTAANANVAFRPGERAKTIEIGVVGDTTIEQDESFSVVLSKPVNASLAKGDATGTIRNDDIAVSVTSGEYQGQTQNGNYVFLTVLPDRTITGVRINDLPGTCDGPLRIVGGVDWTEAVFPITDDGRFSVESRWDGSTVSGDAEWTHADMKLAGSFNTPTSVTGTVVENLELNWKGRHYRCTSGEVRWSAALR